MCNPHARKARATNTRAQGTRNPHARKARATNTRARQAQSLVAGPQSRLAGWQIVPPHPHPHPRVLLHGCFPDASAVSSLANNSQWLQRAPSSRPRHNWTALPGILSLENAQAAQSRGPGHPTRLHGNAPASPIGCETGPARPVPRNPKRPCELSSRGLYRLARPTSDFQTPLIQGTDDLDRLIPPAACIP
eukprot:353713-Chlamydomonas_euryale.AAC.3